MSLRNVNWPGKDWHDCPLDKIPDEIHAYYKQDHQLICAKITPDNRIVLYFAEPHCDDGCIEVWQTLEGKWVHIGPRRRP